MTDRSEELLEQILEQLKEQTEHLQSIQFYTEQYSK